MFLNDKWNILTVCILSNMQVLYTILGPQSQDAVSNTLCKAYQAKGRQNTGNSKGIALILVVFLSLYFVVINR